MIPDPDPPKRKTKKEFFITKVRKHEKEINNNFVLSKFRVFVVNFYPRIATWSTK